jgi:hypothetical protein
MVWTIADHCNGASPACACIQYLDGQQVLASEVLRCQQRAPDDVCNRRRPLLLRNNVHLPGKMSRSHLHDIWWHQDRQAMRRCPEALVVSNAASLQTAGFIHCDDMAVASRCAKVCQHTHQVNQVQVVLWRAPAEGCIHNVPYIQHWRMLWRRAPLWLNDWTRAKHV